MTNSLLKFKVLIITLLSLGLISISSLSYAHSYPSKVETKHHSKIQLRAIARAPNKLLPQALYVQTNGHTFKRKFSFQNRIIKQVYYDAAQPVHKLYAALLSKSYPSKRASSYWP